MEMSKIFQLEVFIQEIAVWKMQESGSVTQGNTSIEVTVYDCKNVPIKRYESGKNKTNKMNSGQNFLFTLDEVPTDENKVFFNVFQNAKTKELVGTGKIPIHELFGDVFLQTFDDKQAVETVQQPEDSSGDGQKSAEVTTDSKNKTKQNDSKAALQRNSKNDSNLDSNHTQQKQPTTRKPSDGNRKKAEQQKQPTTRKPSDGNRKKADTKTDKRTNVATKTDTAPDDTTPDVVTMENLNKPSILLNELKNVGTVKNLVPPPCPPISKLTKDIYPIMGTDSNQCGNVCILMRLTSFGKFSANPIHIHQNHKEIIIQNPANTALYRRIPLDDLRKKRHSEDSRYITSFPSNIAKNALIYNRRSKAKDFSFQCNEIDIQKAVRESDNLLDDQN